jgi:cytochrome c oxidase subunit 2
VQAMSAKFITSTLHNYGNKSMIIEYHSIIRKREFSKMKKLLGLILILTAVFALSACGTKSNESTGEVVVPVKAEGTTEAATELLLKASDKTFKFDQEEYTIKKGVPVKLTLVNESGTHGVTISGLDVMLKGSKLSQIITPGKEGTYIIKCNFPCGNGHVTMTAKLIVAA